MEKWALITGASSGIGEATALELAGQGYNLVLVARRLEKLAKLKKHIEKTFASEVLIHKVDVQKLSDIKSFVKAKAKNLKKLDVLVNNAGLARGSNKFQDTPHKDWEEMIDTNVKGLLAFTREILPYFVANKNGHIVNLGSVAGRWVYPGGAVSCASKFAVRAISEGLRLDLMGTQVRVSNIEPGMVHTEFSAVRFRDLKKAEQVYAGMKPLTARDIAETIGWVVARPKHVNIQELVIYPTDQASVRDVHRV